MAFINGTVTTISPPPAVTSTPGNVASLFGLINTAVTSDASATAAGITAAGDLNEANAYGNAQAIAAGNARVALIGGQVEQSMQQVKLGQTLGEQRAQVSGGGFAESGTALNLLKSSTQQGALEQQITGVNSELQAGGFEEQGAAAAAEATAATAASSAAAANAASLSAIGAAAKTSATNAAAAMGLNIPGLNNLSGTSIPSQPAVTASGQVVSGTAGAKPTYPSSGYFF